MRIESEEYRILCALSKEPSLFSAESFGCVVPPLDFLETDEHCFVVMPRCVLCAAHVRASLFAEPVFIRWGDSATWPWFSTIREALDYMRCLLKVASAASDRGSAH